MIYERPKYMGHHCEIGMSVMFLILSYDPPRHKNIVRQLDERCYKKSPQPNVMYSPPSI